MRNKLKNKTAFTVMEIVVVIVLIGLIAGFAIPSFNKSIAKAHEKDMVANLQALHSANLIFRAKNGLYWDTGGARISTLSTINSTLGINIIASDGTVYDYLSVDGTGFTGRASWGGFRVRVDAPPLSATNPSCDAGTCPSVP